MYGNIFKEIQKKAYFAKHRKILIAVSGGVDSMGLLRFLYMYRDELEIEIGVVRINRKQRQESEMEEAYLCEWVERHQIPIYADYFSDIFSERAVRDFRYQFFKEIMVERNYAAAVTAHHIDDQAEMISIRFLRDSRPHHLSGMQAVSSFDTGELIRPFLTISKKDLPKIFHFEDDSNQSLDYLRNRIRNRYLPSLEKEDPKSRQALQHLGQESQQLFQAIQDLTAEIDIADCSQFLAQTTVVQTILFQNYLEEFPDLQVSYDQFNEMLQLLRNKTSLVYRIKGSCWLKRDYQSFQVTEIRPKTDRESAEKVLEYDSIVKYDQYRFRLRNKDRDDVPVYSSHPILLRQKQAGNPIDSETFSKKLRRLLIDKKISIQGRANAIIGEQDKKIILVLTGGKAYLRRPSRHDIMGSKLYIKRIRNR